MTTKDNPRNDQERLFGEDANWNDIKGRIRNEYSDITDEDFEFMEKNEAEFINRLHQKTGKTKSEVRDWVRSINRII